MQFSMARRRRARGHRGSQWGSVIPVVALHCAHLSVSLKFGRSLFHPFPLFPRCFRHSENSESRFDSDDNLGPHHVEIRCAVAETAPEWTRTACGWKDGNIIYHYFRTRFYMILLFCLGCLGFFQAAVWLLEQHADPSVRGLDSDLVMVEPTHLFWQLKRPPKWCMHRILENKLFIPNNSSITKDGCFGDQARAGKISSSATCRKTFCQKHGYNLNISSGAGWTSFFFGVK